MRQDERAPFNDALLRARTSAYPRGEFVGQESFMRASEILTLARRAGIAQGVSVLDLCCGVAGPGTLITRELGCTYLGVDCSASAVALARELAGGLDCRFEVAHVPPVPAGPFDVVLLLETMLAFPDKEALLGGVSAALAPGGRFVFTVEEGLPLSTAEGVGMPDADTVFLTTLPALVSLLDRAGLRVVWCADRSENHGDTAAALVDAFDGDAVDIASGIGRRALDELTASHRLWRDWLRDGRVRKFELVVEKPGEAPLGCVVAARPAVNRPG